MVILLGQSNRMASRDIAKQVRPLIGLNERQAAANLNYREKVYNKYREQGMGEVKARERADKAAIKYAGKQHRFRAETIVHTELAFAYNRGAHMGVAQGIADGLMGRCAMKWSTAGTNRVCSRCLALKDTIVGYTDESGVTLPPLHPRCRCAIIYDEVAAPRRIDNKPKPPKPESKPTSVINPLLIPATVPMITPVVPPNPKPNNKPETTNPSDNPQQSDRDEKIKSALQTKMAELKLKGEIIFPPPELDFSDFTFDVAHTQGDKHPHDVTEEEARKFITEAYFAIEKRGANSYNFWGKEGATYVQPNLKRIRTAFKAEEYAPPYHELIEVYENALGNLQK